MLKALSTIFGRLTTAEMEVLIDAEDVSNEVFIEVFHRLDQKSLFNCMLACRRFHKLISPGSFWVEYSRIQGISHVLPPLKWRRAAWQKKFAGNEDGAIDTSGFSFNFMQIVCSGEGFAPIPPKFMGNFEAANDHRISGILRTDEFTIRSAGDGIKLEVDGGHGCQAHPDVTRCLAFTYSHSSIFIYVDLVAAGIPEWVLDYVRPKIRISQKVNHRHDCGARLDVSAQLNYHESQWIESVGNEQNGDRKRQKSLRFEWEQWTEAAWEDVLIEFDDYPSGIRHVTLLNQGNDTQFWRGHYGPKIANISIQVVLPEEPCLRKWEEDTERREEDEDPDTARVPSIRLPLMRRNRGAWGIPPAILHAPED